MQDPQTDLAIFPGAKIFLAGFGVILLIKLILAYQLNLFSDEVFYWQASTHPALAYSDLPFVTALLAGVSSSLFPGNPFATRFLFLVLGSTLPFLVYWVAYPVTGRTHAKQAALLILCLPLAALMGLLAVPDVPLLVFGLLFLGCFERAVRSSNSRFWLAAGIVAACGFSTHYRFVLYPFAAFLFLLICKPQRHQWRQPIVWFAGLIASLGLIPIFAFNLNNELSSLSFYLVERHPWNFNPRGLLHVFEQALIVTPPLYFLFLYTLLKLYKRARENDQVAAMFVCFSATNLGVYLVLAPWTDSNSTSFHWSLLGYLPLLVFAPQSMSALYKKLQQSLQISRARGILRSISITGIVGTIVVSIGVGSQALNAQLQPILGSGVLSNKMAGWDEFYSFYADVRDQYFGSEEVIAITDNYYTAAHLEYSGLAGQTYNLDNDKAVATGRYTQYQLWNQSYAAIPQSHGKQALFVVEDSTLTIPAKTSVLELACQVAERVEFLDQLWLFEGEKRFSFYKIHQIKNTAGQTADNCPFPSQGWISLPQDGDVLTGDAIVRGWVFNEGVGVKQVSLMIDSIDHDQIDYGVPRPDVVDVMDVNTDPNRPNLGYDFVLDTTKLPNGKALIALNILNNAGERQIYGSRVVTISNP